MWSLPPELLGYILLLAVTSNRYDGLQTRYKRLRLMAQVSSYWADIIKGTSKFWSVAYLAHGMPAVKTVVIRSHDSPLAVKGGGYDSRNL